MNNSEKILKKLYEKIDEKSKFVTYKGWEPSKNLISVGFTKKEINDALLYSRIKKETFDKSLSLPLLDMEKILPNLLRVKFSFFDKFNWNVYDLSNEKGYWIIYLLTIYDESIGVPVAALLQSNSQMIINYNKQYYSKFYSYLKEKSGDDEEYQKEYEKGIKGLKSEEFKRLKIILEEKNEKIIHAFQKKEDAPQSKKTHADRLSKYSSSLE